jgi:nicotinate-nucleotide adenylyltransferase
VSARERRMTVRLGVYGGTFDPVHVAHLVVATGIHAALGLDRTHVVVAGDPWQKEPPVAPAAERYEAVAAAIADLEADGIVADDREVRRSGPTYTVDTVESVLTEHPGAEVYVPVGYDVAQYLDTWHRVDDLRELVTLVVVNRPGYDEASDLSGWRVEHLDIPWLDVSSSMVRERLAQGLPVDGLVPAAAMRVLRKYQRYA